MPYIDFRSHLYYLVGLFGTNRGLPNEQFIRTMHRLYGVRRTRDVLFPVILRGLGFHRPNHPADDLTRLVAIVPDVLGVPLYAASRELQTSFWNRDVLALPDGGKIILASWSPPYMGVREGGRPPVIPSDWRTDPEDHWTFPFHVRAQHLHDQLLAGVDFWEADPPQAAEPEPIPVPEAQPEVLETVEETSPKKKKNKERPSLLLRQTPI